MATFTEIQTRVQSNVIDLPQAVVSQVATLINAVIRDLQVDHNFKVMEAEFTTVTASPSQVIGQVPSNFKEFRDEPYYVEDLGRTRDLTTAANESAAKFYFASDSEGYPQVLVDSVPTNDMGSREWKVYPIPDGNSDYPDGEYRIVVPYWRFLPALSGAQTNWFTENGAEYIVSKTTARAFAIDWDEDRMSVWEQLAAPERLRVIKQDKLYRLSGVGTLVPHYKGARTPKLRF